MKWSNKSNIYKIIENLGRKLHKYEKLDAKYNSYSNTWQHMSTN